MELSSALTRLTDKIKRYAGRFFGGGPRCFREPLPVIHVRARYAHEHGGW